MKIAYTLSRLYSVYFAWKMLDQSVVFLVLNIAVRPFICHEKWRRFASVVYISWRTSIMNYLQGTLYIRWILAPIAYSKWRNYDMRSFISSQISLSHHMSSNSILSTGVAKHLAKHAYDCFATFDLVIFGVRIHYQWIVHHFFRIGEPEGDELHDAPKMGIWIFATQKQKSAGNNIPTQLTYRHINSMPLRMVSFFK